MGFQSLAGDDGGRALLPALAFSVAIHCLLLWQAPAILPRQGGGTLLAATLRAAAASAPAPAPVTERAVAAARPLPKPAPARAALPVIAATPETALRASAPAGPVAEAAPPPAAAAGDAAAPAPAPGEAGPDADGIRDYRIGLARAARSHRRYPPAALEHGWTGTAEIQVDVSRQGQARQILLARSSGHEILDREALAMMSRAAADVPLPDSLRGHAFAVRLPVVFQMTED